MEFLLITQRLFVKRLTLNCTALMSTCTRDSRPKRYRIWREGSCRVSVFHNRTNSSRTRCSTAPCRGPLCLSPVSVSVMSKTAPCRHRPTKGRYDCAMDSCHRQRTVSLDWLVWGAVLVAKCRSSVCAIRGEEVNGRVLGLNDLGNGIRYPNETRNSSPSVCAMKANSGWHLRTFPNSLPIWIWSILDPTIGWMNRLCIPRNRGGPF